MQKCILNIAHVLACVWASVCAYVGPSLCVLTCILRSVWVHDTGDQTQGFGHARQRLYHWVKSPAHVCLLIKGHFQSYQWSLSKALKRGRRNDISKGKGMKTFPWTWTLSDPSIFWRYYMIFGSLKLLPISLRTKDQCLISGRSFPCSSPLISLLSLVISSQALAPCFNPVGLDMIWSSQASRGLLFTSLHSLTHISYALPFHVLPWAAVSHMGICYRKGCRSRVLLKTV